MEVTVTPPGRTPTTIEPLSALVEQMIRWPTLIHGRVVLLLSVSVERNEVSPPEIVRILLPLVVVAST